MTDCDAGNRHMFRVGMTSVSRRCAGPMAAAALAGLVAAVSATTAQAAAEADAWGEFEARCLLPYEAQFPPIVDKLEPAPSDNEDEPGYWLPDHSAMLVLELAPDDGFSACRLEDPGGTSEAAFDAWLAAALKDERYEQINETTWYSFQWIEPVVAVHKQHGDGAGIVLRVVETDLDS